MCHSENKVNSMSLIYFLPFLKSGHAHHNALTYEWGRNIFFQDFCQNNMSSNREIPAEPLS
jgi:hypothetical protein